MSRATADNLKIIVNDIRKTFSGLCTLLRHVISPDEISIALSLFSADSAIVRPGNKHTYKIIMLNDTNNDTPLRVLFDIYRLKNPVHPEGHYAYYAKNYFLKAHENKELEIDYNWEDCCNFIADEAAAAPEDSWRGTCSSKEKYAVMAVLLNEHGQRLDKLTITQQLV